MTSSSEATAAAAAVAAAVGCGTSSRTSPATTAVLYETRLFTSVCDLFTLSTPDRFNDVDGLN